MEILVIIVVAAIVVGMIVVKSKQAGTNKADGVLAEFAQLRMTATELIEGHGPAAPRHPLAGIEARVEDSGTLNRRITATRLAVVGPFALAAKKRQDDREVYLTVEGPDVAIIRTVQLKNAPAAGTLARQFAAQVNLRSRQLSAPAAGTATVSVVLFTAGPRPISVIKAVRMACPGLLLTHAKAMVENAPSTLLQNVDPMRAQQVKTDLERAGATVLVS